MIGPATMVVQALYKDDPQGLADYIAAPKKIRKDYPEMPPQGYLPEDLRARHVNGELLVITKTNRKSTVHRPDRMDIPPGGRGPATWSGLGGHRGGFKVSLQ